MLNYGLLTEYAERLDKAAPLPEYPRPQLKRDSYINLNGEWLFDIRNKADRNTKPPQSVIAVPFSPESVLSGVKKTPKNGDFLYYVRDFTIPDGFLKDITFLHIDAADQLCEVFVNGIAVGKHKGGYLPATYSVGQALRVGKNTIAVRITDNLSFLYPTGKQRRRRGGIWYTPISGIWQTVWLESVCTGFIRRLKITPDIDNGSVDIDIESNSESFDITLTFNGEAVAEIRSAGRHTAIAIPDAKLWSPESPFLYDLKVEAKDDSVTSYFAMRKFTVDGKHFLLNNKPYFVNGVLDQGYFSDGIYTPASYDAYRDDILAMKRLGFNTLRKHIKIEPMMFYYYCDTLGMLVIQDMVNVGVYSFFKDTIIPFVGFRRRLPYVNVNKKQRENFIAHSKLTLKYLYNCPSIVMYTIFNEGWGQFDGDGMYTLLKALDPTRVYDSTSGWFRQKLSDVASEHIYFKPVKLKKEDKTVILSEFGGYSYNCKDHLFNDSASFGYRNFDSISGFENAFCALYENEILPSIKNGLSGAIYTQLSDVEDETNGILTYDRRVCKLNAERVKAIMEKLIIK